MEEGRVRKSTPFLDSTKGDIRDLLDALDGFHGFEKILGARARL